MRSAKKKIALRVDASSQIGTGHLIRCLTLAKALKENGTHTRFVSRHMPIHLQEMILDQGHEFVLLNGTASLSIDDLAHAHWLGTSQQEDAQATRHALVDQVWDWLVVDNYALDQRWESLLRQTCQKILVIDDLANRVHDCDVLVDQNFYEDIETRYLGKVSSNCLLFLGPRYALLRDEFRLLHEKVKPRTGVVRRVLVFLGGVDKDNHTIRVIKALGSIDQRTWQVDVVAGAQHPALLEIEAACKHHLFTCHIQTTDMAELMLSADLAIGAGGGATWERCCLGLPTLALCVADNQQKQLEDAAKAGLLYFASEVDDSDESISRHIVSLIENPFLQTMLSANCVKAVDGRGVLRIINALGDSQIKMRLATVNDSHDLFFWRNDPVIRSVSHNTEVIDWEVHQRWLDSVLTDASRILLIGMSHDSSVGVVRFDLNGNHASISIYLLPKELYSGLGSELLKAAEEWLLENQPQVCDIHAEVLTGNKRSMRLFARAGYIAESSRFIKRLLEK